MSTVVSDVWASLLPAVTRTDWHMLVRRLAVKAERRRGRADYDTGSILEEEAYSLLAIAESIKARVVIEVGTFIGLSTTALASASYVEAVYTCDASNDCLPSTRVIRTYPKQSSTAMFQALVAAGVKADLFFFDGTLSQADAQTVKMLAHPETVFAVHDYNYGPKIRTHRGQVSYETVPRKGMGNVQLLRPYVKRHVLVEPQAGMTLALLVPESRL